MDRNLLAAWGLDVPRTRGRSISDATSRGSNHSDLLVDSSVTTSNDTPDTTPKKKFNRPIHRSPSSSTGRDESIRSTDSPWNKKYILTLDGGGVRGLSTLIIIKHLMTLCHSFEQSHDRRIMSSYHPITFQEAQGSGATNKKSRSARFLPVHYFDYIAGTSTGGLIAIMLSRLRMSIDDCIQEYENLGEQIFGHPRKFSMRGPIPWNQEKYDHRKLEKVIKDVIKRRHWKEDQVADSAYPSNPQRCRTIVLAIRDNAAANAPYLFRTYEHPKSQVANPLELNPGLPDQLPIWQVARATTAAPTYFKEFKYLSDRFLDGGFGHNNPTQRAYNEVQQVHGKGTVALALSIGTGRPTKVQPIASINTGLIGRLRQLIKYTAATTTDSERIHENLEAHLAGGSCFYERFNVDGGLGDISLGQWHIQGKENLTLRRIREQTHAYINQSEIQERLKQVAKNLVKNRQERSKTDKWDVVATGHRYRCPEQCDKEKFFSREVDLEAHLCEVHRFSCNPTSSDALKKAVKNGRILHAD